jgi:predicted nuclease of restriction endonuclease-like (RecB) superfamily
MLHEKHDKKKLEDLLLNHITKFLLELRTGFAFFLYLIDGNIKSATTKFL